MDKRGQSRTMKDTKSDAKVMPCNTDVRYWKDRMYRRKRL